MVSLVDGANVGAEAITVILQDIDHYSQTGAKVLLMLYALFPTSALGWNVLIS